MFDRLIKSLFAKSGDTAPQQSPKLEPQLATQKKKTRKKTEALPPSEPTPKRRRKTAAKIEQVAQPQKRGRKTTAKHVEAPEPPAKKEQLSEKEIATIRDEPYVNIISMNISDDDPHSGSFTLDWNDKFVANLIRSGYKQRADDTDERIVDRWFQVVCRNIALEMYEQEQADPINRNDDRRVVSRKKLDNGRSEIS